MGITQLDNLTALSLDDSVVDHLDHTTRLSSVYAGYSYRGPLLPAYGTRARETALRVLWHHDYNTLYRGAIAGLVKRIQSTPYEVSAPNKDGDRWQRLLMGADFGDWDRFLSKLILDYSRHDQGAFVELIAPGDPTTQVAGPIVGMANLESLRCYRTGNPEFPVVYYSLRGKLHVMHRSRIIQFVDTPDSEEIFAGNGDCSLSRYVAPGNRQILMGRYIETFLDDKPRPGAIVFGNLSNQQVEAALDKMVQEQGLDSGGVWGSTLRLYGMMSENKPTVDTFSFSSAPEKFDYEKYTEQDVKELALSIGLDIQDIWELTGGALGSGAQSEILAQKSSGKAIGRIYKMLERGINRVFPDDVEMKFKYQDIQQDVEQSQKMTAVASVIQTLSNVLTTNEQRQLLANTVEVFADILIDEAGNLKRYNDADPKAADQTTLDDTATQDIPETAAAATPAMPQALSMALAIGRKDFGETATDFGLMLRKFTGTHNQSDVSLAALRSVLRNKLYDAGYQAYQDGLAAGGTNWDMLDATEKADGRRSVAEWLASQNQYLTNFVDELRSQGISPDDIANRANMWINKSLQPVYFAGIAAANSTLVYPWLLGPTKKHCPTCLANSGQKHTMKEWLAAGMYPGSSKLSCEGYNCLCSFGLGEPGKSSGRIAGGAGSLADRLGSWLRGLFGRGR